MYSVRIEKQALKYINRLDRPTVKRIRDAIDLIAGDPHIGKPLTEHGSERSYRVGGYRILYNVYQNELIVVIVKVNPRGQVYDN
jgi:mRNA interferase RelE/StbE